MTERPIWASDVVVTPADVAAANAAKAARARLPNPPTTHTAARDAAIVAAYQAGTSYKQIAQTNGVSATTVSNVIRREMGGLVPGMPPPAPKAMRWLSPGAIAWAAANQQATLSVKQRAEKAGWEPQTATVVLLALAEESQSALAAQTGGAAPTMRAALYRMMANHGVAKDAYVPLANKSADARKNGVLPRDFWADPEPSDVRSPGGGR